MIILGIDPGTTRTGFAVLSFTRNRISLIEYGCWETKKISQGERLQELYKNLNQLIKKRNPRYLAMEKVFFFRNAKTALSISEAIGIVHFLSAKHHLSLIELTPLEVKQQLVGYGRAKKKSVQELIKACFGFTQIPQPDDAADALAVALAGINKVFKKL